MDITDKNPGDKFNKMQKDNNLHADEPMTPEDALSIMQSENNDTDSLTIRQEQVTQKQVTGTLKLVSRTEVLLGDFFKKLAVVDRKFNQYAQECFKMADQTMEATKNPSEEDQALALAYMAAGVVVKGAGAIWTAIQTEQQLRGVISTFAAEAEEKLPYIEMIKTLADMGFDVAYSMLLDSTTVDSALEHYEVSRSLCYTLHLANYLISVYTESLEGRFTEMANPTMYDVNEVLLSDLAKIEEKHSDEEKLIANRDAMTKVVKRMKSVMNGVQESPDLVDVLVASDEQMMATAINMGLPDLDKYNDEDVASLDPTPHFPYENFDQFPESLDYVSSYFDLLDGGDHHTISQKVKSNPTLESVADYIAEFNKNQTQYDSRVKLYTINAYLLGAVFFLLCWDVFDWKWYWSLLSGVVMFFISLKVTPFTDLRQTCRIKAILLERDLYKQTMLKGGYTEVINFHEIRKKNTYTFAGAIIGFIIGCAGGPFGMIGGCALGAWIGSAIKNYEAEDEDWRDISIGSGWLAKLWCGILSISLLLLLISLF